MKSFFIMILVFVAVCPAFAEWTIVASYPISGKASGLASDGTYLYYGIYGSDGGRVFRFDPVSGQEMLLFNNPTINDSYGMSYDGQHLWITDHGTSSTAPAYALRLDFSGTVLSQFNLPDHYMSGIAYDAGNFWVMTYYPDPGTVYKVSATGAVLQQFTPPNNQPWDICKAGENLWIADYNANMISKVSQTGTLLESNASEIQKPAGIAWDGQYLWYVAGALSAPSTLYKVDLSGAGTPEIGVSFNQHDFGNVVMNQSSSVNLTVSNTGTGDLSISSIAFSVAGYSTTAALPVTIAPNGSVVVPVTFSPLTWGEFPAQMNIHSNDPITPVKTVNLNGYGVYPTAHIDVTPATLDYGAVRINADSGRFFTISNLGMTSLQINSIGFSNPAFRIDGSIQLPIALSVRQEYQLRIWFSPGSAGQITSTATIGSNDASNPQLTINLTGNGMAADLSMGAQLWEFQTLPGTFSNVRAIKAIQDIWGNGKDDLVICSEDYYVRALNGNSSGTADVIWEKYVNFGPVSYYKGLSITSDLNNDGIPDVVIGTAGGDRSVRAYSGKNGTPLWTFNTSGYGSGGAVYHVDARRDFNADGIPDVLAATGDDINGNGPKRIFLLNGVTGAMIWERYVGGPAFAVLSIVDFTGDGIPDALAGASNEAETQARVHGINGATGAIEWTIQPSGTSVWALAQLDDLNADGIADVMVGSFQGSGNYYALSATTGSQIWFGSTGASIIMQLEAVGDVNSDGFNDIAIGHAAPHTAVINGLTGQYIWSQSTVDNAWYLANGGDLTGDGITDLFVGTLYQSNAAYYVNGTDGAVLSTFWTGTPVDAIGAIFDVTGDNSREMVVGGRNGMVRCFSGGPVTLPNAGFITGTVSISAGPGLVTQVEVRAGTASTSPNAQGFYTLSVAPGTYTVSASLPGYYVDPIGNVSVTPDNTTPNIDFFMQMLPLLSPINLSVNAQTGVFSWQAPNSTHNYLPDSYNVFLDGALMGNTEELIWTFTGLTANTSYLAEVTALYPTGESSPAPIQFTFTGSGNDDPGNPPVTRLWGNYPNPFNPETTIHFSLATRAPVTIDVFNVKGQRVKRLAQTELERGDHYLIWDGRDDLSRPQASGLYFYRFTTGSHTETGKMLLMK